MEAKEDSESNLQRHINQGTSRQSQVERETPELRTSTFTGFACLGYHADKRPRRATELRHTFCQLELPKP